MVEEPGFMNDSKSIETEESDEDVDVRNTRMVVWVGHNEYVDAKVATN